VKLAVLARLPLDVAARISAGPAGAPIDVVGVPDGGPSDRLPLDEALAADPDGVVCLLRDRLDAAAMDRAPRLRVIANVAVGLDNIDVAAATARGICVTNTPDVLTEATAELTIALLFAAARRLPEGERLVRSGAWRGWALDQLLGVPIAGATLGIVGLGRIGAKVAALGRALGMRVVYAPSGHAEPPAGAGASRSAAAAAALGLPALPLPELLAAADFVSLHCPLTAETRDLLSRPALALMKPTAVLLNTARGELVDEDALCDQLEAGRLFAAGLDVYRGEPHVSPRLLACPRIALAPHLGSATTKARTQMAELAIDAAVSVLRGERPRTLVNEAAWPPRRRPA
jgi:glyoxylate reductase